MKQELTILQRLLAPTPKPVRNLAAVCALVVLNILWTKWLMYFHDEQPSELMKLTFIAGYILAGVTLGLCFSVDEDALKKKAAIDSISQRLNSRKQR
ncbi:hypothetical protein GO730_20950 [Spirosoma sp. HMF3257]|nr:hypothetical protein [Spirosoma telluris]